MDRLEKLIELLEKKYGSVSVEGTNKSRIREIVREEIERVKESLEEVDDSQISMTFASLERAMKYSKGIYGKMKESGVKDVDAPLTRRCTLRNCSPSANLPASLVNSWKSCFTAPAQKGIVEFKDVP